MLFSTQSDEFIPIFHFYYNSLLDSICTKWHSYSVQIIGIIFIGHGNINKKVEKEREETLVPKETEAASQNNYSKQKNHFM